MAEPEMVIFDCDGVLVDSEPPANRVLARYLKRHGLDMTLDQVMSTFVGLSLGSCAEIALRDHGVRLPDSFVPDIRRLTAEVLAREVKPIAGVRAAVTAIARPACVASSGEISKMRLTLGTTGLLDLFEGRLYSATMVARGKPAPDLFLHAAAAMGADPARCAVVEDSPFGIQAARAAGMLAIGFTGGGHRDHARDAGLLRDAGAAAVIERMAALPDALRFG
ncbi:HAD family hydrolase [Minwuia thermotolerans]|uniref:Hydrolase n=1 Tax=Minwuia thermotolerans TaxID=2056226 RepID=A0A2M9G059_9PROT|nr:HAD family hydrolase [Minwuia thermotolerans]PJK29079.1 hydrolase [Minwuia thermotolerans]